jgi:hypothetical protein
VKAECHWRCGCGFTARELQDGAVCVCGLNPLATGTWRRFRHADGWRWWFTRELGDRALPMQVVARTGQAAEVVGFRVGDLGSLAGRWAIEVLAPVDDVAMAEVWHEGSPYRYVRREDVPALPWLLTLAEGSVVYCTGPLLRRWMLLDAFVLHGDDSGRVTFLMGHEFPGAGGGAS